MAVSASKTTVEPVSRSLRRPGFRLHYWDWESAGPAVVLLHSSSHYGRMWEWVAERLLPDHRVIALDQRGHGDTEQPAEGNAPADYAGDVEAVAQELGLARLIVGGEALGARVALVYAALHPERCRGAVLVGGPDYSTLFPGADVQRWTTHAQSIRQRPRSFDGAAAAREALAGNYPWYSQEALDHEMAHNSRDLPDGRTAFKYDPDWVADGLLHAMDDLRAYAAKLTCPLLILRSERSWQLTPERMPEVERVLPTARTLNLPNASAAMGFENPEGVAQAIRDFARETAA